jgi:predicted AAA+ superfamily ATPase
MKKIEREQVVRAIERANPWWTGASIGKFKDLPKRTHFPRLLHLITQIDPIRALVIMGPRRIGKTVLLYQLIDLLIAQGLSAKKAMYLSLDNPIFRLSNLEELLIWGMEWVGSTPEGATVFFDEVQYLDTWEQQLKALVDAYPATKFVVTGSAAAALHKKSRESGAGRFTDYLLPPLSFYEYILIKSEIESTAPGSIDLLKLNDLYLEYLNYGGFPEAIASEALRNQPEQYIGQDILDKVLGRDLPSAFGISHPNELQKLFAALAYNTSNEVSPEGISNEAGVPKSDIQRYIGFLEAAFLVRIVEKTDASIKRFQRRTHFKVVLTNPSLRSAIFGKLSEGDRDLEALAETAVFSQLAVHERGLSSYRYARWNHGGSKGEVDLVRVSTKGKALAALEIKWSDRYAEGEEKPRSLVSFCKENGLTTTFMTSKTRFSETQHGELRIRHFPTSALCFALGAVDEAHRVDAYLKPELRAKLMETVDAVLSLISGEARIPTPGLF